MTPIELIADVLERNVGMLKWTLADFSDADMLVRPTPGANHAAWQLGHLTAAEFSMIDKVAPGILSPLPEGFAAKFSKETAASNDPAAFLKKDEILAVLEKNRSATAKWVKGLSEADFGQPSPVTLGGMCPTLGHLILLLESHVTMHVGQFQVIRRKLGKPVLF